MFTFKQFVIHQEHTAMKVGTDGVLLGAWAPIPQAASKRFLDVGTGTGLISMMLAQRYPNSIIDAIDIDELSVEQAASNTQNSIFASRINVKLTSVQNYQTDVAYDAIVCNPPYFVNSLRCPDTHRNVARHTDSLPFSQLLQNSSRLLSNEGTLSVILPVDEGKIFLSMAPQYGFYAQELMYVHPTVGAQPKRLMIHLVKNNNITSFERRESHIDIEISRHEYTPEYIALTRDFYLKM